ncbi:hypothetical protein [Planctomycetes bacterium TBK1r]|uniref:hypothetical protein n=1 Tax=Stieleria magnilauensis TaxID=2527963 RepID=UPI0011A9A1E0
MTDLTKRLFAVRFSLRAMLANLSICAVIFAILAYKDARRRDVLKAIESRGGTVRYSNTGFSLFKSSQLQSISIPQDALSSVSNGDLQRFPILDLVVVQNVECRVNERNANWKFPDFPVDASRLEFLDKLRTGVSVNSWDEMLDAIYRDWQKIRPER